MLKERNFKMLNTDDVKYIFKTWGILLSLEVIAHYVIPVFTSDTLVISLLAYGHNHILMLALCDVVVSYTMFKLKFKSGHYVSDPTYINDVRWTSLNLALFVATTDPYYLSLVQKAIQEWNDTGVSNMHLTNDKKKANVIVIPEHNSGSGDLATTIVGDGKGVIYSQIIIKINADYINPDYDYRSAQIVIEHELGHVLGLNHRKGYSIMDIGKDKAQKITKADADAVKQRYIKLFV